MTEQAKTAVVIQDVRKAFGPTRCRRRRQFRDRAGRGARPARRERRGQIDDRQAAFGPDRARPRHGQSVRRRGAPARAADRPPLRHPDRLSGDDAGADLTVLDNMLLPYARSGLDRHDPPTRRRGGRSGAFRRARPSTSNYGARSASSISPISRRSRSHARSSASRVSCCSMSPLRRSSGRDVDWLGEIIAG